MADIKSEHVREQHGYKKMAVSLEQGIQTAKGSFKCYVTQMGVGVSDFLEKSVTKVYSSMLLALRGGGWGSNFQKNSVT